MADDEPEPSHQLHKKSLSCQFVSAIEILGMVLDTGEEEGEVEINTATD